MLKVGRFGPWLAFRASIPSWRIWAIGCGLLLGDEREWGVMFDIGPVMVEIVFTTEAK